MTGLTARLAEPVLAELVRCVTELVYEQKEMNKLLAQIARVTRTPDR